MTANDANTAAVQAALKDILLRRLPEAGIFPSAIEGLMLVRRDDPAGTDRCFERPLASLIVQGRKHALVGGREYNFAENDCLVSGVDLPSVSSFPEASPQRPFLSLFFHLDREMLTELMLKMPPSGGRPGQANPYGLVTATADPEYMRTLLRLVELLDRPEQIAVRAPMILRELHYLLLIGPHGQTLKQLHARDSQNSRILEAVALLKTRISDPVRMEDLARQVNMSLSSLHRHFKQVTGYSPLQYHKQLRLYEAQRLMFMENVQAGAAALSVGYESVTQFNREYKRMFGEPPHRDILRKRALTVWGSMDAVAVPVR